MRKGLKEAVTWVCDLEKKRKGVIPRRRTDGSHRIIEKASKDALNSNGRSRLQWGRRYSVAYVLRTMRSGFPTQGNPCSSIGSNRSKHFKRGGDLLQNAEKQSFRSVYSKGAAGESRPGLSCRSIRNVSGMNLWQSATSILERQALRRKGKEKLTGCTTGPPPCRRTLFQSRTVRCGISRSAKARQQNVTCHACNTSTKNQTRAARSVNCGVLVPQTARTQHHGPKLLVRIRSYGGL